jgi:hypothetical protein
VVVVLATVVVVRGGADVVGATVVVAGGVVDGAREVVVGAGVVGPAGALDAGVDEAVTVGTERGWGPEPQPARMAVTAMTRTGPVQRWVAMSTIVASAWLDTPSPSAPARLHGLDDPLELGRTDITRLTEYEEKYRFPSEPLGLRA